MKCAFAKMSTKGTFEAVWPYGTDLYGRFLYLESGGEQALIAAFDFGGGFPKEAERWRQAMARETGIPAKSIWFHELQIHAAPLYDMIAGPYNDRLIARSVETVRQMMTQAQECRVEACCCDMGTDYTFNREQYVEGLGGVTVWAGMQFDEQGRPWTQDPAIMNLDAYRPQLPAFEKPIYFDNPTDSLAYLFRFCDLEGRTLGTVSRFAGHPDVAVLFELRDIPDIQGQYHYDFDWTGYLSEDLEKKFGGISIYLNGPCADLSVKKGFDGMDTYADSAAECRRIAGLIGSRLVECFREKAVPLDPDADFRTETFAFTLPMKEDIPYSLEELFRVGEKCGDAWQRVRDAEVAGEPAYRVKLLVDEAYRQSPFPRFYEWRQYLFSEEDLQTHQVTVYVSVLRFGGYLFVGVPGESMVELTYWLRARFTGAKTIPIDQVGGYHFYVATPRSLVHGGYTYWFSWVSRESVPKLQRELAEKLDAFLENK